MFEPWEDITVTPEMEQEKAAIRLGLVNNPEFAGFTPAEIETMVCLTATFSRLNGAELDKAVGLARKVLRQAARQ